MTPEYRTKLRNLIIKHESFKDRVYSDLTGHLTLGYGHNLESRSISEYVGGIMLDEDIFWFLPRIAEALPFFNDLSDARKSVLVDMAYNLGLQGLLEFHDMINALTQQNYTQAAEEMLKSKWAEQVGERAREDAYIMRMDHL